MLPLGGCTRWPIKQRELQNHHFDSTVWNGFKFREDDIVIATYAKSGTTWTQQIVGQLLFQGNPDIDIGELSPWVDLRVPAKAEKVRALEAQRHRRFLKTHLPVDALVFSPIAKYIYVGRDGRDIVWSMHHHHRTANDSWYQMMTETPGRVGPELLLPNENVREYFLDWLHNDGVPFWPFWENVRTWWQARTLPNVLLIHFQELKDDLPETIRRIANFLGVEVRKAHWPQILEHCSFPFMKKNARRCVPLGGAFWNGGAPTFINSGTNGRWKNVLTAADCAEYEQIANRELGDRCASWLASGSRKDVAVVQRPDQDDRRRRPCASKSMARNNR